MLPPCTYARLPSEWQIWFGESRHVPRRVVRCAPWHILRSAPARGSADRRWVVARCQNPVYGRRDDSEYIHSDPANSVHEDDSPNTRGYTQPATLYTARPRSTMSGVWRRRSQRSGRPARWMPTPAAIPQRRRRSGGNGSRSRINSASSIWSCRFEQAASAGGLTICQRFHFQLCQQKPASS